MKRHYSHIALAIATLVALSGCVSVGQDSSLKREVNATSTLRQTAPIVLVKQQRVVETPGAYIPLIPRKVSNQAWLKAIQVKLVPSDKQPLALSEVMRMLSRQGLNITSELPLDRYTYTGYSLNEVDAETALRMVLGSVGLDYSVDLERRLVVVKPLSSRTWYLNIGNKKTTYEADGSAGGALNATASASSSSGGLTSTGLVSSSGSSHVSSSDDFWASLRTELESRLTIMLPDVQKTALAVPAVQTAGLAPIVGGPSFVSPGQASAPLASTTVPPTPGTLGTYLPPVTLPSVQAYPGANVQAPADTSGGLSFSPKKVGGYAVNPETGAVTVQAPHWIMQELDSYFGRVQEMYNTDLLFQGELVLVTTDSQKSEGLDISSFAKFAKSRYGVGYTNNGLGGVTLSTPKGGLPTIAAGPGALAGPLLGVASALDGFAIFNAYLTNIGHVTTLQKPVLATTSGTPANFRKTITKYYNTVTQEAVGVAGATGLAALGTKNVLVPQEYGTILRVNPRYDVATGLIRVQIELLQTTQTGIQTIPQALTAGNTVETLNAVVPNVSKLVYSGEALLRDGDLIVMGGQTEDTSTSTRDGITGLMDSSVVGGVFGTAKQSTERNIFYFALRVTVNKRAMASASSSR
ncbi:MAG: hypothetical protein Q7U16_13080 [Agitococcus sp.]|nr:hypothetical protein [Agitococcus sp.]